MPDKIIFRELQMQDCSALERIITETWHYNEFCSSKTAVRLARVFLNSCLANQTFTQVAVINGIPVGVIMGKSMRRYKRTLRSKLRLSASSVPLLLSREGRLASRVFSDIEKINAELLSASQKEYQGEVAFFAVSENHQKKGIGRKLFQALTDYMRSEDICEFYLFTDTSCSYPFYEQRGMKRRCQKSHSFTIGELKEDMLFFLYEYQFERV